METSQHGNDAMSPSESSGQKTQLPRWDWRQIGLLYWRETRTALRERSIVTNSILIPLCLYPFLLWVMFTGFMFVEGQTEGFVSRVAVRQWPQNHPGLNTMLSRHEDIKLLDNAGISADAEAALRAGKVELVVDFVPVANSKTNAASGSFQVLLLCDESKDRSVKARKRFLEAMDVYRDHWLAREARKRGITPEQWMGFTYEVRNVATDRQMGAFLAGMMLPMLFVIMVSVGCFYPAIDSVAGERERHTWETLMTTSANRLNIAVAKYLYVTSFGGLAGLLNILAVSLTMKPLLGSIMEKAGESLSFSIPLGAIPLIVLGGVLLAGFVAAGMMIFASFASTFKEGQAMATPFYLLVILPGMLLQMPGIHLTPALACVPVINVTLMIRAAIQGEYPWLSILITVGASLLVTAACIRFASWILQFEEVVSGSFGGGLSQFLKKRLRPGTAKRSTESVP
jgi:sodium transport system permease protein